MKPKNPQDKLRTVSTSVPQAMIEQLEIYRQKTRLTMGVFNGLMLARGFQMFLEDGLLENPATIQIESVDIEKERSENDLTVEDLLLEEPDYVMAASR